MQFKIICDFDGTISIADTTDALLDRFADPAWHAVEEAWLRGEIGSAVCMQRQIALLNASPAELEFWLQSIAIDADFTDFVAFCKARHIPLSIASDGIDYVIRRVMKKHGHDNLEVTANHMRYQGNGQWLLTPHRLPSVACRREAGVCKCSLLDGDERLTIFIGDGRSDFCVSEKADFVFAKAGSALSVHCEDKGLAYASFNSFRDVRLALDGIGDVAFPGAASFMQQNFFNLDDVMIVGGKKSGR